jgi:glutathione synthase/RimK-type ligase-like ATP-grasp enzyme
MLMPIRQARLALASCQDLPDWEVDDLPFHRALQARGIEFINPAWDSTDVDWASCEMVLIRTTWDYAERCTEFVEWAESVAQKTLLLNPPQVIRWNTDKHYLRELERGGARLLPTAWLERGTRPDIAALMRSMGGMKGFLKPIVGASARETLRFSVDGPGIAEAQAHCERLLRTESLMLQPYQPSVETQGEFSVLFFDGEPSHGVRKIPVPGDYRVQDDYGASDQPSPLNPELLHAARQAIHLAEAALELEDGSLLYGRADFLMDSEGQYCLNELELVEPSLFFRHDPESPDRLARAIQRRLEV